MRKVIPLLKADGIRDEHPCYFLPDRKHSAVIYTNNMHGDRAFQSAFYRAVSEEGYEVWGGPHLVSAKNCPTCQACVPVRVCVRDFNMTASRMKTLSRHADLTVTRDVTRLSPEHFALYQSYNKDRFPDDPDEIRSQDIYSNKMQEWSRMQLLHNGDGKLVGALYYEDFGDALIVGHQVYDRELGRKRSFGTFGILSLIEMARDRGNADYVYLGPWARGSRPLEYKKNFYPLEAFDGAAWVPLDPEKTACTVRHKPENIKKLTLDI